MHISRIENCEEWKKTNTLCSPHVLRPLYANTRRAFWEYPVPGCPISHSAWHGGTPWPRRCQEATSKRETGAWDILSHPTAVPDSKVLETVTQAYKSNNHNQSNTQDVYTKKKEALPKSTQEFLFLEFPRNKALKTVIQSGIQYTKIKSCCLRISGKKSQVLRERLVTSCVC